MRVWLWSSVAVALAVLAGCASLSDNECRAGDWRGIGFSDGASGRAPDHIERHRKACADVGVSPDAAAWQAGRTEGLGVYCQPATAYRVARRGGQLAPYCTAQQVAAMRPAYDFGTTYREFERDIDALRSDRQDVDFLIGDLPHDASQSRSRLYNERARIDRRIFSLESRQRRYAFWPG